MIRRLLVLSLTLALSGCAGGFTGFGGGGGVDQLPLVGGDVIAAGPDGYCVDPATSRARTGLAVLSACAILADTDAFPPAVAVLTLQVGPPDSGLVAGRETTLEALLGTPDGAALLSEIGAADVIGRNAGPNLVTVYYVDDADPAVPGTTQTVWRAFTDINGRLVTLSLRNLDAAPLSRARGEGLLIAFLDRMWQVNGLSVPTDA